MSFLNNAILAHTAWKGRLRKAITDKAKLDAAVISTDNNCDLGKWIYGDGQTLKSRKEFEDLRQLHKRFHACAGGVATDINSGRAEAATTRIERGDFSQVSREVVQAIEKLIAATGQK